METTFEKDGFIGIFDNVFEEEYIEQLISFFNDQDNLKFVEQTKNRTKFQLIWLINSLVMNCNDI